MLDLERQLQDFWEHLDSVVPDPDPEEVRQRALDRVVGTLIVEATPEAVEEGRARGWPGPRVAVAAFAVTVLVGVVIYLLGLGQDVGPVAPPPETTPQELISSLQDRVNAGDLEGALDLFADDAICRQPGSDSCADLFGFFIAADAAVAFDDCRLAFGDLYQCAGYFHTSIHTALGISPETVAQADNQNPTIEVIDGLIQRFLCGCSFTGDPALDGLLGAYLSDIGAEFADQDGHFRVAPDMVPAFTEAARQFAQIQASGPATPAAVVGAFESAINAGDVAAAQSLFATEDCSFPHGTVSCDDYIDYLAATNASFSLHCQQLSSVAADVQMSCTKIEASAFYQALGVTPQQTMMFLITDRAIVGLTVSGAFTDNETDSEFFEYLRNNYPELYDQRGGPVLTGQSATGLIKAATEFATAGGDSPSDS